MRHRAHSGGNISDMFILCHGYAGANHAAQVSGDFGGMGLQLGTENVLHANVIDVGGD